MKQKLQNKQPFEIFLLGAGPAEFAKKKKQSARVPSKYQPLGAGRKPSRKRAEKRDSAGRTKILKKTDKKDLFPCPKKQTVQLVVAFGVWLLTLKPRLAAKSSGSTKRSGRGAAKKGFQGAEKKVVLVFVGRFSVDFGCVCVNVFFGGLVFGLEVAF